MPKRKLVIPDIVNELLENLQSSESEVKIAAKEDTRAPKKEAESTKQELDLQPTFSHLSPNSSMVRSSYWRSEGCGFESRLGTRKCF